MFTIYQVTNELNGKSYIGFTSKSKNERWKRHLGSVRTGSDTHFHNAIRKYGVENFRLEILEEGWSPEIGKNVREPYWISVLKPEYNSTNGGEGVCGYIPSEEENRNNSLRNLGNQRALGAKHSSEENHNKSMRMMGQRRALGYRWTTEQKQAQSERLSRKQQQIVCSHCKKSGGISGMHRYHFDKCKEKLCV
jgi:group I intron endonuclease